MDLQVFHNWRKLLIDFKLHNVCPIAAAVFVIVINAYLYIDIISVFREQLYSYLVLYLSNVVVKHALR